jgi:hypothetical protein
MHTGLINNDNYYISSKNNLLDNLTSYKEMYARSWDNQCINLIKAAYMYGYEFWSYKRVYLIALKQDSKIYEQLKQIFIKLNITKIE